MIAATRTAAPAAMTTITLTSSQLDDLRSAVVEHRNHLDKHRASASHGCTAAYWAGHVRRLDDLLLLVAKA
jgi:hypothetical protein